MTSDPSRAALGAEEAPVDLDGAIEAGGEMTPEALRTIAGWLDTYDALAEEWLEEHRHLDPERAERALIAVRKKDVQSDLRRWADRLQAHTPEPGTVEIDGVTYRAIKRYGSPGELLDITLVPLSAPSTPEATDG